MLWRRKARDGDGDLYRSIITSGAMRVVVVSASDN